MGDARKFGYDIPLTACFEYTSRAGAPSAAARGVVCTRYAHRSRVPFPEISPAGIEDVGNCYYDTSGEHRDLLCRNPLHYPKPAYVALATLTKVLDSVKLVRQMPFRLIERVRVGVRAAARRIYALDATGQ